MLFYRYKAQFGSDGYKKYQYGTLRFWFYLGFAFIVFEAKRYGMFYPALSVWFFELFVIFMATEHRIFTRILPWMLMLISLACLAVYFVDNFSTQEILKNNAWQINISKNWIYTCGIWHSIGFLIAIATSYINKRFKRTEN